MITDSDLTMMIAEMKVTKPFHFEGERDGPLSEIVINQFEEQHGVRFPDAFRKHLTTEGAGDFAFGTVYSPDPTSGWSLWKEYEFMPHRRTDILPFSDNGCGDYLCFPIVDGVCEDRVVWADHEQGYQVTSSEMDDFRDFIVKTCLNPA